MKPKKRQQCRHRWAPWRRRSLNYAVKRLEGNDDVSMYVWLFVND